MFVVGLFFMNFIWFVYVWYFMGTLIKQTKSRIHFRCGSMLHLAHGAVRPEISMNWRWLVNKYVGVVFRFGYSRFRIRYRSTLWNRCYSWANTVVVLCFCARFSHSNRRPCLFFRLIYHVCFLTPTINLIKFANFGMFWINNLVENSPKYWIINIFPIIILSIRHFRSNHFSSKHVELHN